MSCLLTVKKGTSGMSFKSSVGPSHPISEIVTSHVCRLKKTKNKGDQTSHVFLIKGVTVRVTYSECQVIEWLQ